MCQISVITSVYNGERFIAETIKSIQDQTFTDWEYLITDNCSTDRTAEIIEEFAKTDPRIKLFKNAENVGQIPNLNRMISLAKGKYIARTDADDLSYPTRFAKQYAYLEEHPEVVLVGSQQDTWWDGEVRTFSGRPIANTLEELRFSSLFFDVMPNSSFFYRKSALEEYGIQYRDYAYAEDWALIDDLLGAGEIFVLPEALILYRVYGDQLTQRLPAELRIAETEEISLRYLSTQPIEDKTIFEKTIKGKLTSRKEYHALENALVQYALSCGLGSDAHGAASYECVRHSYRTLMNWQRGNLSLFFTYAMSPLRQRGWFFSVSGLVFLKKCLLHRGKVRHFGGVE